MDEGDTLKDADSGRVLIVDDDEINRETVKRLAPAWIHQTGVSGGAFETTAAVNDGRMYITTPNSHLICVDVRTGETLWRYDADLSTVRACCGPVNKGVALLGDRVYWATLDARLARAPGPRCDFVTRPETIVE